MVQDIGHFMYPTTLMACPWINFIKSAILHEKAAVIDGVWPTVDSTNLDYWSLLSNDEVNAAILSREFAVEMEKVFTKDLAESDEIRWESGREGLFGKRSKRHLRTYFLIGCSIMGEEGPFGYRY
jgi:phosphatidylserine/phosphatidylglycerophosphate/cardiolipin synthase-like enzyme